MRAMQAKTSSHEEKSWRKSAELIAQYYTFVVFIGKAGRSVSSLENDVGLARASLVR
jgi:hypothetical protein